VISSKALVVDALYDLPENFFAVCSGLGLFNVTAGSSTVSSRLAALVLAFDGSVIFRLINIDKQ
jgi:hypothetical protein